jgi:hypothetical protein
VLRLGQKKKKKKKKKTQIWHMRGLWLSKVKTHWLNKCLDRDGCKSIHPPWMNTHIPKP